jgi:hypothetical protein
MRFRVSRAGMAVAFAVGVLRCAHGQDFDVVHIEQLFAEGITAGCSGGAQ